MIGSAATRAKLLGPFYKSQLSHRMREEPRFDASRSSLFIAKSATSSSVTHFLPNSFINNPKSLYHQVTRRNSHLFNHGLMNFKSTSNPLNKFDLFQIHLDMIENNNRKNQQIVKNSQTFNRNDLDEFSKFMLPSYTVTDVLADLSHIEYICGLVKLVVAEIDVLTEALGLETQPQP